MDSCHRSCRYLLYSCPLSFIEIFLLCMRLTITLCFSDSCLTNLQPETESKQFVDSEMWWSFIHCSFDSPSVCNQPQIFCLCLGRTEGLAYYTARDVHTFSTYKRRTKAYHIVLICLFCYCSAWRTNVGVCSLYFNSVSLGRVNCRWAESLVYLSASVWRSGWYRSYRGCCKICQFFTGAILS